MSEIIRYKNEMNTIKFNGFNAVDQNIFMALCARMKDRDTETIVFDFTTLRKILNYSGKHSNKEFVEDLERMNKNMLKLTCSFRAGSKRVSFVLFPTFTIDVDKNTLTVRVNPDFAFLLNDFTGGGYTQMELKRFISIEGKYAKTMYKYLRQYRSTGVWQVEFKEFRDIMCVPQGYPAREVKRKVIEPAIEELKKYFPELKCEPVYLSKQGAPLGGYVFKFVGDDQIPGQMNFDDISKKPKRKTKPLKTAFNNFHQRDYDFDELERKLLEKERNR